LPPHGPIMAPRIAFIVEGRYLRQEMPRAAIRELQARGLEPDVLCPQGARFDPQSGIFCPDSSPPLDLNRSDVVVARCRDELGLAMLAYAETAHMLTINTRSATEQVRSKAEMAVALERPHGLGERRRGGGRTLGGLVPPAAQADVR